MELSARNANEDERDANRASGNEGYRYLQRADGSWSLVGDDGWEVEFADLDAEVLEAFAAAVTFLQIDVEPFSVADAEIR
ncbi:hypothetical protein ACFXNW_20750 [Nocardia sp. NPDC059180]|uniref:hypothetical protein n=1 Tax=Nocardia sp. NPDC059180 TaxID=3346761 RepID=UPI0036C8CCB9